MAYAVIMEFDADWATHLKIDEAVGDGPVEGLMVHAAGPSDGGTRTVDIWASRDDSERFFVERIFPASRRSASRAVHRCRCRRSTSRSCG